MTLAIHGKSRRRRAFLALAALIAVAIAFAGGLGNFTKTPARANAEPKLNLSSSDCVQDTARFHFIVPSSSDDQYGSLTVIYTVDGVGGNQVVPENTVGNPNADWWLMVDGPSEITVTTASTELGGLTWDGSQAGNGSEFMTVTCGDGASAVAATSSITIVKQGLVGTDAAHFTHDIPGDADGMFDLSAGDNSIVFAGLVAGAYHVTEDDSPGYTLAGVGCADDSSPSATATAAEAANTLEIVLADDQHLTCTFVNAQAVEGTFNLMFHKYVDGAPAIEGSFDFTWTSSDTENAAGSFTLDAGNSFTSDIDLASGSSFHLSETGVDGTCEPGDTSRVAFSIGSTVDEALAAEPAPSLDVDTLLADTHVIIWNIACSSGSITIVKEGLTEGVVADFTEDVTPGGAFSLDMVNNSQTFENLSAGSYHFTELALDGWTLASAGCAFDASPTFAAPTVAVDNSLEVILGEDEHITCTFVNAAVVEQFTVTTTKYVDGAIATDGSFAFTATPGGPFTLDSANSFQATSAPMDAGTAVTISEDGIDATCDDTDTDRLAGYGIGATLEDALAATPTPDASIADLPSDQFVVVWNQLCANLGTITIVKDFDPDSAAEAGFTATGSGVSDFSIPEGPENGMLFEDLSPGAYGFTEAFMGGVRLDAIFCTGAASPSNTVIDIPSRSLTLNLEAGEDIVCTFTNVEDASVLAGGITIVKTWDADGEPTTFTTTGIVGLPDDEFVLDDAAAGDEMRTFENLEAGLYTFTEVEMDGWQLMAINCTGQLSPSDLGINLGGGMLTVNLDAGQEITCTFANRATATTPTTGSITITKVADPDTALDFGFTATGTGLTSPFTLSTGGGVDSVMTDELDPGAYTVTEDTVEGWTLSDITCTGGASASGDTTTRTATITLAAAEDVVCTFTNTEETTPTTGSITITKVADPDTALDFGFTATGTGLTSPFTLSTGGGVDSVMTDELDPGAYIVTEDAVEGWTLSDITCTGGASSSGDTGTRTATITLAAGEDVVCTFTNTQTTLTNPVENTIIPSSVIETPGSATAPVDVTAPTDTTAPLPSDNVAGIIAPAPNENVPVAGPQPSVSEVTAPQAVAAATPGAPEAGNGNPAGPASLNWMQVLSIVVISGGLAILTAARLRSR